MSPSLSWRVIALTAEEVERRRSILDARGYYAQCSALLVIITVRAYQTYALRKERALRPADKQLNSGPRSWLDSSAFQNWTETRKQYLVSLIWLAWLLCLSAWNTGNDYLHLTKSLGHVALSQLPLQTLMAPVSYISSRPTTPSLLSAVTSIPQPSLTPYHRLFGRLILLPLLLCHALLYIAFFAHSKYPGYATLLRKRIRDSDVQWGLCALSLIVSIILYSRPFGRKARRSWIAKSIGSDRRVFYAIHVLLVSVFCAAAYSHVAQARVFILEALAAFVANAVYSWTLLDS